MNGTTNGKQLSAPHQTKVQCPTEPISWAPWTPWRAAGATLVAAAVSAGFALLYLFQDVVIFLFMAIVLSTALKPVMDWGHRRELSWSLSVSLVFGVLTAAVVTVAAFGLPILIRQAGTLAETLPKSYATLRNGCASSTHMVIRRLATALPAEMPAQETGGQGTDGQVTDTNEAPEGASPMGVTLQMSAMAMRGVLSTAAVLLLAMYWSLQRQRTLQALLLLVAAHRREEATELALGVEEKVGAYLRGQSILCVTVAILSLIVYWWLGLPQALPLALIAGVLEAVPMLGPVLGAVPALLVAATTDSSKVVWVLLAAVVIQQLENYLLAPRVMDKSVGVHPVVTLLAIAGFGALFGLAGAILAIPLAAIMQLMLNRYVLKPGALEPAQPEGRDRLSRLRYEAQELIRDVRLQVRHKSESSNDVSDEREESIESIARDLDLALAQSATDKAEAASGEATG
ncbi:MAG TPA: AI-2E family transporter [Pirellulales bacterium]|nr:AI-2E family transporter [Pirellulales bacterium]